MKNKGIIVFLVICCSLILGVMGFLGFESNRFPFGTKINGVSVSNKTVIQAEKILSKYYDITIKEIDNEYQTNALKFATIKYDKKDIKNTFKLAKSKSIMFINNKNYIISSDVDVNKDKLKAEIDNKFKRTDAVDSNYEIKDYNFVYNKAVNGTQLDYDKAAQEITDSITNIQHVIIFNDETYLQPKRINYSKMCKKYNKILNTTIKIKLYDGTKKKIKKKTILKWIKKNKNGTYKKNFNYKKIINKKKVNKYVTALKKQYDNFGKTQKFITHDKKQIKVKTDCWGYKIDKEETKNLVLNCLYNKKSETIKPVYSQTANYSNLNNIGNTYIEVSIKDQKVWYYKNGKQVFESTCVTGDVSYNRETPKGLFYILEKVNGKYLTGPGYKTWVNKWMRVTWDGVGFHDAGWRGSFGDDIYETNGSHGCINLPSQSASQMYDLISEWDPIIIY